MKTIIRIGFVLLLTSALGGCLLISPFHGKILESRTETIPFQAWTTSNSNPLVVECMPTNRFGPSSSHGPWTQVTTLPVSNNATLDLNGGALYSASRSVSLPESCWYLNRSNNWYYTSIRLLGNGSEFHTVDRDGVNCVMESIAASGSWVSWLNDSCYLKYSNGSATKWMAMRTQG